MKSDVEGVADFDHDIERMKRDAARLVKREVRNALHEVEQGAVRRVPVGETGELQKAIAHTYTETETGATGRVGILSRAGGRERILESALAAEFGTKERNPEPFLFPAAEEVRPRFYARLLEIVGNLTR